MKASKKIKLGKLNFYIIDNNYIDYLSQFDKHIAYNKNQNQFTIFEKSSLNVQILVH